MFWSKTKQRLQEVEAKLTAINESQAMIEFLLDGTIIAVNENFLQVMGYSLPEVIGKRHAMFMPAQEVESPDYREFWDKLQRGEFQARTFRRIAKDGRDVWLQASYNPVRDSAGKPVGVIKIATDVTRARMENTNNHGQIQAIHRSQAVIEFDIDGNILTANENFLRVMGYGLAEIVGHHHGMFVVKEEREGLDYQEFWRALGRGEFRSAEFKRVAKDGREVWLQATYNPILGLDGRPVKIVKFATDVTRERNESANYRGQIEAIHWSQAVIEFDLNGNVLTANDLFLRTMKYSLAEIQGKHHSIFVTQKERNSPEYAAFWAALAGGEFRSGEFRRVAANGDAVWLRATYNPIRDLNGRPCKVVKFATDVSQHAVAVGRVSDLIENVAAGAHQLDSSISEISMTMLRSKETADRAVQNVAIAAGSSEQLSSAAQAMGRVVGLIGSITQRINLLALNATIESARAGEAGRGFAVVANEVKNLASQAKAATDEIAKEIDGIRAISVQVVDVLPAIKEAIDSVSQFVTSTSAAVEEQSVVTREISTNMQTAATHANQLRAA